MLDKIVKHKLEEIKTLKKLNFTRKRPVHDVEIFLKEKPLIAEVKQASPTLGDIKTVNPIKQAQKYADAGAGAISVLTDERFFKGSISYLYDVAHNVALPILCKDFILSEMQIENAYNAGADFILLMSTILSETRLKELSKYAYDIGLNILFEVHTIEEFKKLQNIDVKILGVNSRDLKTLKINKSNGAKLLKNIEGNFLKVAESGINSNEDIKLFKKAGADAFLIGSYLMKSNNIEKTISDLFNI